MCLPMPLILLTLLASLEGIQAHGYHTSVPDYSLRLVDGTDFGNGKLQSGRNGRWYFDCKFWQMQNTEVVCRQLGFQGAVSFRQESGSRTTASGDSFSKLDNYYKNNCQGTETRLSSCPEEYQGRHDSCDYVLIKCSNKTSSFRLVGGSSANQGRVEFWGGNKWLSISTSSWTESESKVLCRQLGYIDGAISFGSSSGYTRARYGQSQSTTCSTNVKCSGWEPTLGDCSELYTSSYCTHAHDVSVKCHPKRQYVECHCLVSSECNRTTGSCPGGQCAVGWAGDFCQIELPPALSDPPRMVPSGSSLSPRVNWDKFSYNDFTVVPVVGYSVYYIDTSQIGYEEHLICDVGATTTCRTSTLPAGRKIEIGVACRIKTGSTKTRGPLSPTVNFTTYTDEKEMDFILMNYSPLIELNNPESSLKLGGYNTGEHQTNNVNFGRKIGNDAMNSTDGEELNLGLFENGILTSDNNMFPLQSTLSVVQKFDFTSVLLELPANATSENIGVFYTWSTTGILTSNITTFSVSKEAKVRSRNRTTIAGYGERLELEVSIEDGDSDELRWRHNGGDVMIDWNGKTSLIIESVRTEDGGIYECYIDGERELGLQAIIQVFIRDCPTPKWGADCDKDCPVCYNGGVCHTINGTCLCPSGFMGDDCSEPCGDNNWGRFCSEICSSSNRGCDAILFCLPEPLGCSCMAGFKGSDCKELCPYGTFGADCKSLCHCKFNACDRSMGCMNITCDEGFSGPQCQDYDYSTPCPDGFYGTLCQYKCHCSMTLGCLKNGTCPFGCQEGWGGEDCQFAIPALLNPPRILRSNFHSVLLEWDEWEVHKDYGLGNVTGYRLFYRYTTPSEGVVRSGDYTEGTELVLRELNPCRRYEIFIRAYRTIYGELFIGRPSSSVFHDMACNYGSVGVTLMANPAVVDVYNKTDNVNIFVYSGALSTNMRLRRTCSTGAADVIGRPVSWFDGSPYPGSHVLPTMMFPENTMIEIIAEFEYHALIAKIPGESSLAKSGAFSADILGIWALPSQSTIIILDKNANVKPVERTVVVGTGDRIVLSVTTDSNTTGLRWRYNGGNGIKEWKDKGTVIIEHARTKDSGIYECHFLAKRNQGNHAIIQLNVKDCPLEKYGPGCALNCPVCYNGGICDAQTSLCVCPSGFTGNDCSEVCNSGYWGEDCSLNCDNEDNGCRGNLFCPASPLGCACLPGFHGHDCNKECNKGFYGADCKQVCNCPVDNCDSVAGCEIESCFPGFHGPQCQEHVNVSCTNGNFGSLCNQHCHCQNSDSCYSNGTCADRVCDEEWGGHDCQIALPYLEHGPTLYVSPNRREITVSWFDWVFGRDFGTGPVVSYEVLYKDSISGNYTTAGVTTTTEFILNKLKPGKQYNVAIKCLKDVDKQMTSGPLGPASAVSTCKLTDV